MSKYTKIKNLEEISEKAISIVGSKQYVLNFNLKLKFKIGLTSNSLADVSDIAKKFQNESCPKDLHLNHGMYIHKNGKDGIKNVIEQLKNNNSGNRALISLINQEDIVDSEDKPIPSFMILQFALENKNKLYITIYFRALEVSQFLRINVEEIRQIIEKIQEHLSSIQNIYLNIISFRAFVRKDINTLLKPEIDLLDQKDILKLLLKKDKDGNDKNLENLIMLLEEKNNSSSVIEYKSFEYILDWLEDGAYFNMLHENLRKELIIIILKEIINLMKNLKELRKQYSHGEKIDNKDEEYKQKLNQLIIEIRNDS